MTLNSNKNLIFDLKKYLFVGAKIKYFQNSGKGGEREKAEEIKVPAESVNAQKNTEIIKPITTQMTGADVIVYFHQTGTEADTLKGPLTSKSLKLRTIKNEYLAEYKEVKESTTTIVTWQGKKYMNMNAKIEDYSSMKVNPVTDPSVSEWSSLKQFQDSNDTYIDETFDMYFINGSTISPNVRSFTTDYPLDNQGCPTVQKQDSDNLDTDESSKT